VNHSEEANGISMALFYLNLLYNVNNLSQW